MALSARRALIEAVQDAAAHRLTSLLVMLVALAMTAATLLTMGRLATAEQEIVARVDAVGTRLITVTVLDTHPGAGLSSLQTLGHLPSVEWTLGLGPAVDTRVGPTGQRSTVAARTVVTDLPSVVSLIRGREPRAGEAVVSGEAQRSLRLIDPAGFVRVGPDAVPVVGGFTAHGVLEDLERLALVRPSQGEDSRATLIYVLATRAGDVQTLAEQIPMLIGIDRGALTITTSEALLRVHDVLSGTMGASARLLTTGILGPGLLLVLLTVSLALSSRRADLARHRALGASRDDLLVLVLLAAGLPAGAGTLLGLGLGVGVLLATGSPVPGPTFLAAVVVLVLVSAALAAVLPALGAALRDPVTILRVP